MRDFGRNLGLAFQVQDDVIGIWGDPVVSGKPAGADLIRRKKTLPVVYGLARSGELRDLLRREELGQNELRRARQLLENVGSRDYAETLVRNLHGQALARLESANLYEEPVSVLRELGNQLVGRLA